MCTRCTRRLARTPSPPVSDPSDRLRAMEQHRSVREARRTFSEILNTAAYGDQRIVIVRHKTEVGAFVNMNDLEFLRRERLHAGQAALPGGSESWRQQIAAERELLDVERAWLTVLLAIARKDERGRN